MMLYVCVQTGHNKSLFLTTGSCISVHVGVKEYAYRSQCNHLYLCKLVVIDLNLSISRYMNRTKSPMFVSKTTGPKFEI